MCDLTSPIFHDADKAREHLEALRWANGRFCPHCGEAENTAPVAGEKHRPGLYYCNACEGQFTVTVGTVMERSHIPLHKWVAAFHLMAASKKGISAHQLHRMLGITYKSAWFMAHRIRESMREINPSPIGGEGKTVEADNYNRFVAHVVEAGLFARMARNIDINSFDTSLSAGKPSPK